jgi:hypothetical protein
VYLYINSSGDQKSRMKGAGHVARMGDRRSVCIVPVGKPTGKTPLGRPRQTWEDNIKMGLKEIGWDGVDWIDLAVKQL